MIVPVVLKRRRPASPKAANRKRVECDLYYINNWSIWLDMVIIVMTIVILFKKENSY